MQKQTDDPSYASRMQFFYDRSNEKGILRNNLETLLQGRRFKNALDIGPGPGEISGVLYQRAEKLTLIEIKEDYKESLQEQYPQAEVVIGSIHEYPLKPIYDAILFSQGYYYLPENQWLGFAQRLLDALTPGGILIIILNADRGDGWETVHHFWERGPEFRTFHYRPWSDFKKDLASLCSKMNVQLESFPHQYEAAVHKDEIVDFVGGTLLAITDPTLVRKHASLFEGFSQRFLQPDGTYLFRFQGEIVILRK